MNIEIFKNNEFGAVRVLADERGEPWIVAKDVCDVLGYTNPRKAINDNVDEEDRINLKEILKSNQQLHLIKQDLKLRYDTILINESGFFSLVLRSKLPQAKKFKKWVTGEILPAIRKHGGYLTPEKVEEVLLNPDTIIKLATELKKEREEKEKYKQKVIELKPKAFFAEVVNNSDNVILVREFAKLISTDNFKIGEKKLYQWLREQGYLMSNNQPYQKYVDMGIFKVVESSKTDARGVALYKTTKITGKGQVYLQKKIYDFFNVKVGA